jgi:regulator of protease activity HflC (stomatin/prohibitin superfamily)
MKRFINFNRYFSTTHRAPWPIAKANTFLNICPEREAMVIERLGKFCFVQKGGGFFFAIPVLDQIKYVVNLMEQTIFIEPLHAITSDNVSVTISGNVYVQFIDPMKAAYGNSDPLLSVMIHAQSSMRNCVGSMELDEVLRGHKMNAQIVDSIQSAAQDWGMNVRRYEVTDISTEKFLRESMDKQAAAERTRRETVLNAEGEKQSLRLRSEGLKIQLTNESEGNLVRATNEAEATKRHLVLEAEGRAQATLVQAEALAKSLEIVSKALESNNQSQTAVQIQLAEKLIEMQGEIGKTSNTIFFNERPADLHSLMAQAKVILQSPVGSVTPLNTSNQVK